MADKEGFNIQGVVEGFPAKNKGAKGIYWKVKTNVGVVNISGDTEPVFEEGKLYQFWGRVSKFKKDGEDVAMKWCDEYCLVDGGVAPEKTQEKATQTQKSTTSDKPTSPKKPVDPTMPLNGPTQGMIINNSVIIVTARIKAGIGKADPVSIKQDIEFWNEYFENMVRTGKLYNPF